MRLSCQSAMEMGSAPGHGGYRLQEARDVRLGAQPLDSDFSRLFLQLARGIGCNHQNGDVGVPPGQVTSRFQPVHFRHDEVQESDIRHMVAAGLDGVTAVRCLTYDHPPGLALQHRTKMRPNHRAVIHYKDTKHAGLSGLEQVRGSGPRYISTVSFSEA
jgi:hypothetical protein